MENQEAATTANTGRSTRATARTTIEDSTHLTYSSSSIVAYLGRRCGALTYKGIAIDNAVPWLAYLDIFKNYYANKQEESYYWIGKFEKDYKVDDSNIIYTTMTGEPAIASGYFLIKNQIYIKTHL